MKILVTGGAGFIGSNIVAALAERKERVVVCDSLGTGDKWQNIAKHEIHELVALEHCIDALRRDGAAAHIRAGEPARRNGALVDAR